ncbi:SurA N-terminal domain-containing protein [Bradyrhizobium sp. SYSU BS000235]|uniref:peptidylprolyl isomerase n=1 Tax=Bradyrhizobium sp. SYSU BS000235 TaxID=3411332 RepID=UPI003C75E71F
MTLTFPLRFTKLGLLVAAIMIASSQGSTVMAQSVAAIVNGEPITNLDIEQRIKLTTLTTRKTPSRQEALDELINDKVKVKEGKKYGLDMSTTDIDAAFGNMASRMRMNSDQLVKTLEGHGIRPETLKSRIKADMTWGNLVRGRFQSSLVVNEKDIRATVGDKIDDSNPQTESYEYLVRPIVLILPRGSSQAVVEQRRKEAELLRNKIQSCEEANELFRSMRDAAIRDQLTKTSADLPPPLRELLDKTPVGKLTPPEVTKQGIEMVALCSRKPTTADTPAKREAREKIYNQRYEAKSKSYLQEARKSAMIEMR